MEADYTYYPCSFRGSVRFREDRVFYMDSIGIEFKYIEVGNFRP